MKRIWLLIAFAFIGFQACGRGYSDGRRTGYVQKFSRKGLVIKSWEGELLLNQGQIVTAPEKFHFSVLDDKVAQAVQAAQDSGERVSLVYTQWFQSGCGMDTDYEVTAVQATTPSTK